MHPEVYKPLMRPYLDLGCTKKNCIPWVGSLQPKGTYAYRHKNPSKKTKDDFPRSVLGAIWLAVEASTISNCSIWEKTRDNWLRKNWKK